MTNTQIESVKIFRKQQLHATITRACRHCGAAGDGKSHFEVWNCHICGNQRGPDESQTGKLANINNNVIWERIWRAPTVWETITSWFRKREE